MISTITTLPTNQSPENIYHANTTNYYDESKYPIQYTGIFIILALTNIFI